MSKPLNKIRTSKNSGETKKKSQFQKSKIPKSKQKINVDGLGDDTESTLSNRAVRKPTRSPNKNRTIVLTNDKSKSRHHRNRKKVDSIEKAENVEMINQKSKIIQENIGSKEGSINNCSAMTIHTKDLESLENDDVKEAITIARSPAKNRKNEAGRSFIGLDGESDLETEKGTRKKRLKNKKNESKESISLVDNQLEKEKYTILFKEFALLSQRVTLDEAKEEFDSLPIEPEPDECQAFYSSINAKKNRYSNIPCLDISRVKLNFMSKNVPGSDYIHANYVTSRFLINKYIVTQGPKKNTIIDFWRMIWQEKTTVIVMLCQFNENNREKCAEYFPRNSSNPMKLENLSLTFEDSTINKSVICTKMKLSFRGESRIITHFQWMEWPDYQVPGSSETMLQLLRKTRFKPTPPVIHCAAGVGRSGTFIAIEIALMAINDHFEIPNIRQIVADLRVRCRCAAVQTLQQYMMIRKIVLDFGTTNRLINEENYGRYVNAYRRCVIKNTQT